VCWRRLIDGCGRRVAVLHGGRMFACRQCNDLAYRSQREADDDRATRRADTIRRRLGWEAGILNGNGWKPKGMHWRTFERLQAGHDTHYNAALAGMAAKLGLLRDCMGGSDFPGWRAALSGSPGGHWPMPRELSRMVNAEIREARDLVERVRP